MWRSEEGWREGGRREGGRLSRFGFIAVPRNISTPASLCETSVCPSEREGGMYFRGRRRPGDHPSAVCCGLTESVL